MKNRVLDNGNPLLLISLAQFSFSLAMTLVDPILPLYASSFNISYVLVGIVVSSFGFTRIFFEIPGGLLTDRFGTRLMLILGYALITISNIVAGVAQTFVELTVARAIVGIGSAIELTASLTYIGRITTIETRGRNIALFQSAGTSAQIIGPTIGGLIADIAGRRSIFFVAALFSTIGAMLVSKMKFSKNTIESNRRKGLIPSYSDMIEILRDIRVIAISGSAFAMFFLFSGVRGTMIPLFGAGQFQLSSSQIGLVFSLTSLTILMVLFFITHRLERIIGRSSLLPISLSVCSISVLILSFSSDFMTLAVLSIPLGIGFGLLQPIPFATIIDFSNPAKGGLSMGILRTIADLGLIIGPMMVGWLMYLNQPLLVFYLVASIIGALSFMTWIVFRKPRGSSALHS